MPKLSLVIPVYNEEILIDQLFERTTRALNNLTSDYEIICVDDGSVDSTLEKLKHYHAQEKRFKVLSLSRNFGHQAAIFAGLTYTRGEFVAVMDGDLQDPPELLGDFLARAEEGYDVVYAVRKKRKESFPKRMVYWAYYRIFKRMSNIYIPLDSGDFALMRNTVVRHLITMREQSLYIRGIRSWLGFRQIGLEYDRDRRQGGEPKYTLRKLLRLAFNGIFSFSEYPVRLISRLGLAVVVISIVYIIITLVKKYVYGDVPQGFTTLIIFISLFSGVQLVALGLIGEYMVRIYDETRRRPLFIVREEYID
ncbi:MAG: glycosyltransferase family 2 protein [Bacteroidales bacterium]|nr:glycosyltransferase family 2 protein [Bacteroidales bacterium]